MPKEIYANSQQSVNDKKGSYEKVPQEASVQDVKLNCLQNFKVFFVKNLMGLGMAGLAAFFFCCGMIVMKKANEYVKLSGFDHLVIFFAMTLICLPGTPFK